MEWPRVTGGAPLPRAVAGRNSTSRADEPPPPWGRASAAQEALPTRARNLHATVCTTISGVRLRPRQVFYVTITTLSATATTPTRQKRADAQRNYAALLTAADAVFAEQGAEASLEEVAKRAKVGIGTLYRHFPTRRALILATIEHASHAVNEQGRKLMEAPSPGAALQSWLRTLLDHASAYNGLGAEALRYPPEPGEHVDTCSSMRQICAALLARAQAAGAVREDVDATDLFLLVYSLASASAQERAPAQTGERLLAVVCDGLRANRAARP